MNKSIFTIAVLGALTLAGFGCSKTNEQGIPAPITVKPTTEIKYYISPDGPDNKLKYCNGADMDSAGYRQTLTKEVTTTVDGTLTGSELAMKTIQLAAEAEGLNSNNIADQTDFLKIVGDTAYVKPAEGWAGVSIFLCAWQPFVERNLEQFERIKSINWNYGCLKNYDFKMLNLSLNFPCDTKLAERNGGVYTDRSSEFSLSVSSRQSWLSEAAGKNTTTCENLGDYGCDEWNWDKRYDSYKKNKAYSGEGIVELASVTKTINGFKYVISLRYRVNNPSASINYLTYIGQKEINFSADFGEVEVMDGINKENNFDKYSNPDKQVKEDARYVLDDLIAYRTTNSRLVSKLSIIGKIIDSIKPIN